MTCCSLSVVKFLLISLEKLHTWDYFPQTCFYVVFILDLMLPKL